MIQYDYSILLQGGVPNCDFVRFNKVLIQRQWDLSSDNNKGCRAKKLIFLQLY